MNEIKKRTLFDKCRDAYRAFCGKQLGSLTFGIDVKKCHECEYRRETNILYLCDQRACQDCTYPDCEYTTDIHHAKNFECMAGYVKEKNYETGEHLQGKTR